MDDQRATKRRRTGSRPDDALSASSTTPAAQLQSELRGGTMVASIKQSSSQEAKSAATSTTTSAPQRTAQEIWQEAKAKSRAGRQKSKTREHDATSDAEGAYTIKSVRPNHIAASSIEKPKQVTRRAQPKPVANGASKADPSKRSSLGFFQQFKTRKDDSAVDESTDGSVTNGNTAQNTPRSGGRGRKSNIGPNGSTNTVHTSPSTKSAALNRTFEDEIRDIEQVARNNVVNETDGRTTPSGKRKTPTKPRKTPTSRTNTNGNSMVEGATLVNRRRSSIMDLDQPHGHIEIPNGTPMEIDDSEDELQVNPVNRSILTTPSKQIPIMTKPKPVLNDFIFQSEHLSVFKNVLFEKVVGKRAMPLIHFEDEYAKVNSVVGQTITSGESNSMLLIGARGSGKTALLNKIINEHTNKHPDAFLVVRLNGFIHTDDHIALREIWRQLGREMDLEDNETSQKNYADTLTTLLALLSHPAELGREQPDEVAKSVIFILDEFELFASHPRQTLLYNLFDIAQSRKAPIAVLGLTTRVDVAESLEKRVKSRFSHRYVHLSLSKNLQEFQETCLAAMTLQEDELSLEEKLTSGKQSQSLSDALLNLKSVADYCMATEPCAALVRRLYYTTKSVPEFMSYLLTPIATLDTESPMTSADFAEHFSTTWATSSFLQPDSKMSILPSLSTLQMALLICAARLVAIHDSDVVSFPLAYDEYKLIASKAKLQASASGALAQGAGGRLSSKDVARDSWEGLINCGLVLDDGRGYGRIDVGLEEIGGSGMDLGQWGRWCKEI